MSLPADGLNEKLGRFGGNAPILSANLPPNSLADSGRRIVAWEAGVCAEEGDSRAGKTKGGLGRGAGLFSRGDGWSAECGEFGEAGDSSKEV